MQRHEQLVARHDPIVERMVFMTGGVLSAEVGRFLDRIGRERWLPKPIPVADLRRLVGEVGLARRS